MYLYLVQKEEKDERQNGRDQEDRSVFGERLVRKALYDYCDRQRLGIPDHTLRDIAIERTEKGKPYFTGPPATGPAEESNGLPGICFSVSHSGNWWGCLMAAEPIGFDMEAIRKEVHYEKIAQRYFTEAERDWILAAGTDAFFDVWVRKEAYVKFLGTGLAEGLDSFSVVENGRLSQAVIRRENKTGNQLPCYVGTLNISDEVKAAYCCGSGKPVKAIIDLEGRNKKEGAAQ